MAELADALDLGSSGQPCGFDSHYPYHTTLEQGFALEILALKFFRNKIIKNKILHNTQVGDTALVAGSSTPYLLYNQCIKLTS